MNTQFVPARTDQVNRGNQENGSAAGSQANPQGSQLSQGIVPDSSRYVCFGKFHVDTQRQELYRDGTRVKMQGKVYQALMKLLESPGEVVTREALRMRLWPADTHVNYDANVNTTVNKLRQILGDSPEQPVFVETIPRKGYCFVAKVEFADQPVTRNNGAAVKTTAAVASADVAAPQEPASAWHSRSKVWVRAAAISLIIAGALFGAALVLYAHRGF